ncbi:UDP-2,4-diacetamido-2,4,6-trideoxy-beta-L-altropyranose hydrolase [Pseudomonas sp. Z8(2022)]|uniref:UDP-2,4-diacetamido-2,4, 6-trideoxy-beta-L-altropyranose hydrolase n=1 Tax=Pseudomonas sp. Z8(2022) TaxID=2962597 RepID=UPI0021F4C179|nr:UDP-2,4-diacetamido-2,4,6-trideoxy-beta-L-altropyranose hydrolase [Pseudomonas sp. Z8(2022)]UYP28929.1 UDP-2,4-diacetamido-2,4,6-trideoxy-beta-L-altropyranose hydrolase [Pseudomonas sp. Z8(2022)]
MNVVIRVDASQHMGSGHVMRCVSLAEVLIERNHEVVFVCVAFVGSLIKELTERGFQVWPLPAVRQEFSDSGWDWLQDAENTLGVLNNNAYEPDWVIVDHYQLDGRWHNAVVQCGAHIAVIDDLANRQYACDLLVDQNAISSIHERYPALVPEYCQLLLGPRFTLLRREFSQVFDLRISKQKWLSQQGYIVVFMGGADSGNNTQKVLESLITQGMPYPLHVLVGVMNTRQSELQTWCQSHGVAFTVAHRQIGPLLAETRAAIVACGMFAVELQALEIPCLLTPLSDIQKDVAEYFISNGRALMLPLESLGSSEHVTIALSRLLNLPWEPDGRGVVPLDGARRIVEIMEESFR